MSGQRFEPISLPPGSRHASGERPSCPARSVTRGNIVQHIRRVLLHPPWSSDSAYLLHTSGTQPREAPHITLARDSAPIHGDREGGESRRKRSRRPSPPTRSVQTAPVVRQKLDSRWLRPLRRHSTADRELRPLGRRMNAHRTLGGRVIAREEHNSPPVPECSPVSIAGSRPLVRRSSVRSGRCRR